MGRISKTIIRCLTVCALVVLLTSPLVAQYQKTQFWCGVGGVKVPVVGTPGSTLAFQQSAPACTVTVYYTGLAGAVTITSVVRASNVVTLTLAQSVAAIAPGAALTVAGVTDTSFNGNFTVLTVAGAVVTYAQTAAPASSSGGTGTFTPPLYTNATGTAKANPFTAAANGLAFFYASPAAHYDIVMSGGGLVTPVTLSDVAVNVPAWAMPTAVGTLGQQLTVNPNMTAAIWQSKLPFDVRDYGALCDGVTNDATAIQAAITAAMVIGGKVSFPVGTCVFGSTLTIAGNQVMLKGQGSYSAYGAGATNLRYTGSGHAIDINGAADTNIVDITLTDFNLDNTGTGTVGVYINGVTRMRFVGFDIAPTTPFTIAGIQSASTTPHARPNSFIELNKSWINSAGDKGIILDFADFFTCYDSSVVNNITTNVEVGAVVRSHGFFWSGSCDNELLAPTPGATAIGIDLQQVTNSVIENGWFETELAGQFAIRVGSGSANTNIKHNYFTGNNVAASAIKLDGGQSIEITGNTGSSFTGAFITNASSTQVKLGWLYTLGTCCSATISSYTGVTTEQYIDGQMAVGRGIPAGAGAAEFTVQKGAGTGILDPANNNPAGFFDSLAVLGTGSGAVSGLIGIAKATSDAVGDKAIGMWGYGYSTINSSTQIGGRFETKDVGTSPTPIQARANGAEVWRVDGNGNSFQTGQLNSTKSTGTAPLVVASTTPVANLAATPTTYNAAGTQITNVHVVRGSCVLGTSCVITLAGSAAFADTNYACAATDATAAAAVKIVNTAAGTVTITGTGTDTINYLCVGQ